MGIIAQTKYIPLYTRYVRAKLQVDVKLLQIIRPRLWSHTSCCLAQQLRNNKILVEIT